VSFPYKLPEHSYKNLLGFLHTFLSQIVEDSHYEKLVNTEHCREILEKIVPFLQTPRRIKRLLNAFSTSYTIAGTNLHWGELLALEALKLYRRETYEKIVNNKAFALGTGEFYQSGEFNERHILEEKREVFLSSVTSIKKEKELIKSLFPIDKTDEAYKERRVSDSRFFYHYFHIELNNSVLTEKETQHLIDVLGKNPERFSEQLTTYIKENINNDLLISTLDTLIDRVSQMNDDQKNALLGWCFNSLDDYTDAKNNYSNSRFFLRLLSNFLEPFHQTRRTYLTESEKAGKSTQFYEFLCQIQNIEILANFIVEHQRKGHIGNYQLSEEQLKILKILAIKQFKALIEDENYFQSTHPIPWIFLNPERSWNQTTEPVSCMKQWFEKAKQYPRVLSKFVYGFHISFFNSGVELGVVKMRGSYPSSFNSGIEWVKPDTNAFLNWGIDREEAIEFLPKVIDYCKENDSEKISFMEQLLKELTEPANSESP
jgi:hypothetical protein